MQRAKMILGLFTLFLGTLFTIQAPVTFADAKKTKVTVDGCKKNDDIHECKLFALSVQDKDINKAQNILDSLCNRDNAESCFFLGKIYLSREESIMLAIQSFKKAGNLSPGNFLTSSQTELTSIYDKYRSRTGDLARKILSFFCDDGNYDACYYSAFFNGLTEIERFHFHEKGCPQANPQPKDISIPSCRILAEYYATGIKDFQVSDLDKAEQILTPYCNLNSLVKDYFSCQALGSVLEKKNNFVRAVAVYKAACNSAKVPYSCLALANIYKDGKPGVEKSDKFYNDFQKMYERQSNRNKNGLD